MVNHYVLRHSLLRDVKGRLFGESGSTGVVLHGMGGSGKTQLAFECCRHAEETLRFMATLWIDASSPKSVVQSYKKIASCISDNLPVGKDGKATVSAVQKTLREWERRWLVVFDNYDDPTAFNERLIGDYIPYGVLGSILFTSQHHDSRRLGHLIKVQNMTEEESVELLLHRSPFSMEEKARASEIAIVLGHLPLALDQAAAYIGRRGLSLQNFIAEYNARKQVILREIPAQWEYRKKLPDSEKEQALSVFTTWEMSFGMIRGPEAKKRPEHRFLTLAAFFDNKLISERYFRAYCDGRNAPWMDFLRTEKKWDSRKFGDLLAKCGKLSLLHLPDQQNDELRFSIHPLVGEWLKCCKKQTERRELILETCEVLCAYLGTVYVDDLHLQIRQETLAHIDACVLNEKNFCARALDTYFRKSPWSATCFAGVYYAEGRYNQAARLFEQIFLAAKRKWGFKNSKTLVAAEDLANTYATLHRPCIAEALFVPVLSGYENEFGTEHFRTARVTTSLAIVLTDQERWNEAELLYMRALAVTNNPDESRAVQNLASCYRDQGRYQDAEDLYKRTLAVEEKKLDLEHPNILRIKHGLAITYCCQGWYDEAEGLYKKVIAGYKRKIGTEHCLTQDALEELEICRRIMAQNTAKGHVRPPQRGSNPSRGTSRSVDVQGGSKKPLPLSERIQGKRLQRVFGRCLGDQKE
jgi:tetratricopeptide (TPR) repeat protein